MPRKPDPNTSFVIIEGVRDYLDESRHPYLYGDDGNPDGFVDVDENERENWRWYCREKSRQAADKARTKRAADDDEDDNDYSWLDGDQDPAPPFPPDWYMKGFPNLPFVPDPNDPTDAPTGD